MKTTIITNGHVIDPANGVNEVTDILIENGVIARLGKNLCKTYSDAKLIDANGKIVCPGFVDLHTHLREPGREDKETIKTGTMAAAAGGFTSIVPMANTTPVCDCAAVVKYIKTRAESDAIVNVFPAAAVTKGLEGSEIVEFGDLYHAGAVAFTDDGKPIMNTEIMRRSLEYTKMFDLPVMDHCEDMNLAEGGVMNAGQISTQLGLKGIPPQAESIQVSRDVDLAAMTGGRIHIQHVSKAVSLDHIRRGKAQGVKVTAEATPHHLCLTDEALLEFDTSAKMNPALGTEKDRLALIEALNDGTIDCIATDHAPHTDIEKDMPITSAPFGTIGLETAFAACYTYLVKQGLMSLETLIEKMTSAPAQIIKISPRGTLSPGAPADLVMIDLEHKETVTPSFLRSKSKNSCFLGRELYGIVMSTYVNGNKVFQR